MSPAAAYANPPQIGASLNRSSTPEPQISANSAPTPSLIRLEGSTEQLGKISLGTLFDGRFRVLKPIPVTIDRSDEGVAAIWQEIDEFGHADSASAASVELARSLVELYSTLDREQMNLGPDLERIWIVLKEHVQRVRP
jgi:hypothetical protein